MNFHLSLLPFVVTVCIFSQTVVASDLSAAGKHAPFRSDTKAEAVDSFTLRLIFRDPKGRLVPDVTVVDWQSQSVFQTDSDGTVILTGLDPLIMNTVSYGKEGDYLNGVTVLDLVAVSKHLLDIKPFEASWQFLAADVNRSGTVSALDMVEIRKLLLGQITGFQGSAWRFEPLTLNILPEEVTSDSVIREILVYKMGDVNATARVD
jgi:hypothetical protein